jgi:hypothetical protein
MTTDLTPGAAPESPLKRLLRAELEQGRVLATDPRNAGLPELARRVTTLSSPWFSALCKVCRHKFREGDRVRLCPQCGTPYHDDDEYGLPCWQAHFQDGQVCTAGGVDRFSGRSCSPCDYRWDGRLPDVPEPGEAGGQTPVTPAAALTAAFIQGLETSWRPFGGLRPVKVEPGSPLSSRRCPWCRFDIRAGDWVVTCLGGCGACFHQDVWHHLTCWNEWSGAQGKDYCPITGQPCDKGHGAAP